MSRIVGHLDLDYFYAQVEEVEHPSLKGTPVVVCVFSGRTDESGVVSTANYKAREYGVRSGMPIAVAKRRLQQVEATFVPMDRDKYEAYSDRVMETLRAEVDVLEQTGIDEAFFDITKKTGGDYAKALAIATTLKAKVLAGERLTCSVGIGPNKVVAKIASDFKKPDGLTLVRDTEARGFLSPLAVEKIYGVGPKTAKTLEENGIETVSELARFPAERLEDLLGRNLASYLHRASLGEDDQQVVEREGSTQLSRIITLKRDTDDAGEVVDQLMPAIKDLHAKLASRSLFFKSISVIGIRKDLSMRTKARTLEAPTNDYQVMEREVRDLFRPFLQEVGELRRAGVRLSGLQDVVDQRSLTEFTS